MPPKILSHKQTVSIEIRPKIDLIQKLEVVIGRAYNFTYRAPHNCEQDRTGKIIKVETRGSSQLRNKKSQEGNGKYTILTIEYTIPYNGRENTHCINIYDWDISSIKAAKGD